AVDREADLPGRLSAVARGDDADLRALRLLRARRREPAPALRADAARLARALRDSVRPRARDVRREVRAHVANVSRGLDRGIHDGGAAALPGGVRAAVQQRCPDDPRAPLSALSRDAHL